MVKLTKRQIHRLIFLSGMRLYGYTVVTNHIDGCPDIKVPTAALGHAIVRALRKHAERRLEADSADQVFPSSSLTIFGIRA